MDDLSERLKSACVVIGEAIQIAVEALGAVAAAFGTGDIVEAAGAVCRIWCDKNDDGCAELARRFDEIRAMQELADYAEESEPIPPPKKIPRPAKYIGPVNKANYTANRPHRVARSSCRTIKR